MNETIKPSDPIQGTKKPWLSKTLWFNAIAAVAAIAYPPANAWIAANPGMAVLITSGVNELLRVITKDKISLED